MQAQIMQAQTMTPTTFQETPFQDNDCILITDAGIEALTNAPIGPDDAEDYATEAFTPTRLTK